MHDSPDSPTATVHVAVYDTLADWEVGHKNGFFQLELLWLAGELGGLRRGPRRRRLLDRHPVRRLGVAR